MIRVIGLMPELDLMPLRAVKAIQTADLVVLQSERTECAADVRGENEKVITFDTLYEEAEDFDSLYEHGARLLMEYGEKGDVVFGIIGSLAGNGFLEAMKAAGIPFETAGGSYLTEEALRHAAGWMNTEEYSVVSARSIENVFFDTSIALVITEIDNDFTAAAVKCVVGDYYAEETEAVFYLDGQARKISLGELDRIQPIRTGGVLVLPPQKLEKKERYGLYDLVRIMKILRGKNGCPWDAEQTHQSLRQYLLEEAYEVVDAIDADDIFALYDELGDVFLQVVFHSEIARQCGEFDIDDVATAVCQKMIGRHPHIFGDVQAKTADDVLVNWEAIKREEKKHQSFADVLHDVPKSLGAMMRAYKLQKKAAGIGFDWDSPVAAMEKLEEELEEWRVEISAGNADRAEAEAGDLLFSIINVLRLKKINPEVALNRTCRTFTERIEWMEKTAEDELGNLSLPELEMLWQKAKKYYENR